MFERHEPDGCQIIPKDERKTKFPEDYIKKYIKRKLTPEVLKDIRRKAKQLAIKKIKKEEAQEEMRRRWRQEKELEQKYIDHLIEETK